VTDDTLSMCYKSTSQKFVNDLMTVMYSDEFYFCSYMILIYFSLVGKTQSQFYLNCDLTTELYELLDY